MEYEFIKRFEGYEVVSSKELHNLEFDPDFIPPHQLLFGFVGLRRGHLIFLDLEPKPKKHRKRKYGRRNTK